MTYCVGMILDRGLVFMSDTRTNAGVDNISVFRKTRIWHEPGDRTIVLMSAGNLATTQSVIGRLDERDLAADARTIPILQQPTMFRTAELIGRLLRDEIQRQDGAAGPQAQGRFGASLILGGQIAGSEPRLFLIYPEGNFIEATPDTPFFQIGETKYGRPIIVRAYDRAMSFPEAVKLLTVSFDSTLKANLSVGLPLDVTVMERGTMEVVLSHRIAEDDPYFHMISKGWGAALSSALRGLPNPRLDSAHWQDDGVGDDLPSPTAPAPQD
ncbi:peptidase [Paracoccus sp. p3-h83]|uniref:peptidase n=1 Tax=Paracoccus sp. p3-h83 TaxID=3342805 RepID=UPI0035B92F49